MDSRRRFLAVSAVAAGGFVAGCATDPVTGKRELMLVSEAGEIDMDRQWAPHQFSADYGAVQNTGVNAYISGVGMGMAPVTHRPQMPYNFRAVNAVAVNGYTMPAGSIALTRGLMLMMENEAQLASVLGHEMGHVSARHSAQQVTKSTVMNVVVAGATAYAERENFKYRDLAAGLGALGSNLLLARYSRDDEREADALGMEYMTRAGYNPQGMAETLAQLQKLQSSRPGAVELLFATHPMSEERCATARQRAASAYATAANRPMNRERYMDEIAPLRAVAGAVRKMQDGETAMMGKRVAAAETCFREALKEAPDDYAGLLLMAKCCYAQNRPSDALRYVKHAREAYPGEAQASHLEGMVQMKRGLLSEAVASFTEYERRLPGNPGTAYFRGLCLEGMGNRQGATAEYLRYRKLAPGGEFSTQVQSKLVEWAVLPRPSAQAPAPAP